MLEKFEEEKEDYLGKFQRYQNDKIEVQNKNVELQNQLDVVRKEKYQKENDIQELNKKIDEMAIKLNDMKTLLLNKQLSPKTFKVEMIKPKKK
jgi:predicted  nucleic acid-binding Zn-ribbon protein